VSRNWRRFAAAAASSAVLLTCAPAFAAGNGYGAANAVPPGVPGGFTLVLTAHFVGRNGGHIGGRLDGLHITIHVPSGGFSGPVQVALTEANLGRLSHSLPANLHSYSPIFAAGVIFDRRGHAVGSARPVSVTITGSALAVGDVVVSFRDGRFVVVGHVVVAGRVTIDVRGVSEIAILRP
jgi:hypothetical protein